MDDEHYTKLYRSITTSTVWMQPDHVRLVWITLLAHKDKHGNFFASLPGLAHVARVTLDKTKQAIEVLSSPDEYSRTPDYEGRRIEAIEGGWRVLNHTQYRNRRDTQDRKEYERLRKAEQRSKLKEGSPGQSGTGPDCPGMSAHTDTDTKKEIRSPQVGFPKPEDEAGWKRLAKRLKVETAPGEDWNGFKQRIRRKAEGMGKVA